VALAPGSIWGAKRWPYFPELVGRLSGPAVAIGGPSDAGLCGTLAAAAPERVHNAAGQVGPRTSAALIARAAALVTNDAAPLHLAGAVGTPVVAIFGPSAPSFGFAPLGPLDIVLEQQELLCRPCSTHGPAVCPLEHHRCMQELGVGIVADALSLVLSRSEDRRAVYHRN
jgi:heptosyltransferase-2